MYSETTAVGRLTKDPVFKQFQNGQGELALFTVAVNTSKDKTQYYDCVAFNKTAEIIKSYLSNGKGRMVLVNGTFQNNDTTRTVNGVEVKNYGMNLAVNTIKFLDAPTGQQNGQQAQSAPRQQQAPQQSQPAQPQQGFGQPQGQTMGMPQGQQGFQQNQNYQQPAPTTPDPFANGGFAGFNGGSDDLPF